MTGGFQDHLEMLARHLEFGIKGAHGDAVLDDLHQRVITLARADLRQIDLRLGLIQIDGWLRIGVFVHDVLPDNPTTVNLLMSAIKPACARPTDRRADRH